MSLIDTLKEPCVMLDKRTVPDGRGGTSTTRVRGATISAAVTVNGSNETRIAEAQGVKAVYTVTTSRAINLQYHDVFQRESDSKIFRVTSDGDDMKSPVSSRLDMRIVTAEEWTLPADEALE